LRATPVLLRTDERGLLLIGQASHAWISGQLARAWGNERFGAIEPYEEVCLAAEQHDVGMARWDLAPSRNPDTGLPHSFTEMPLRVHLGLWSRAARRLLTQSRYAALLVSMHGTRLYELRDLNALPTDQADAIRGFFGAQRAFQQQLLASLRDDASDASAAAPDAVARNSQLIWTWDFLSLAICLDWAPDSAPDVPAATGPVDLSLTPGAGPRALHLDPWPFATEALTVRAEGRRLDAGRRFDTDEALTIALEQATWETVEFELRAA
jgi:hypothetical protein